MNSFSFFDILLIIFGIYILCSVRKMKKTQVIASVFSGRNIEYEPKSDIKGFIEYVSNKSIVMAVVIMIGSLWNLLNSFVFQNAFLSIVVSAISLLIIIFYVRMLGKAQERYLIVRKR